MQMRIDWFRVLADLRVQGYSLYSVADETGIPRKTLEGYRNHGAEPRHSDGELLLALWERAMLPPVPTMPDRTRRNRRETAQGKD